MEIYYKKNDYSNEEISIKAKINETLILTYNENEIHKDLRKQILNFMMIEL